MASLQREPTGFYHVVFRFAGIRYKRSLDTKSESGALARRDEIAELIDLLKRGRLKIPGGIDPVEFILVGGDLDKVSRKENVNEQVKRSLTLSQAFEEFFESIPDENLERSTIYTMKVHKGHLLRHFKRNFILKNTTPQDIQSYVNARLKEDTQFWHKSVDGSRFRRKVGVKTIKKELITLGTIWRWAAAGSYVDGKFPNTGLRFPKMEEKQVFRTIAEILLEISQRQLTDTEADGLWECVYLNVQEIKELLEHVKQAAMLPPFAHAMLATAAFTGARRSELMRAQRFDIDTRNNIMTVRERKRVRGSRSTRQVPLCSELKAILNDWLMKHPGGTPLFCYPAVQVNATQTLTPDQTNSVFRQAVTNSKWRKLSGWHCLRHSFISNLACLGTDQRIIDEFVGHTTEEMRRRYRHLFPNVKNSAIERVFG